MPKQLTFDGVKGYASYEFAKARGQKIADARPDLDYRWVVIRLPNGRFAPLVILNNSIPGGPGEFMHELNCCCAN